MAKSQKNVKQEVDETDNETKSLSPEQQMKSFLKANEKDHYNFEPENFYKVPCSSLTLTAEIDGGISPGGHRAVGITAGGKTSCTLDFMYHFLNGGKNRRALYVKSEGRLSQEVKDRSGVTFTNNPEEWTDGTCFIFESNVYEAVFGLLGELIRNNPNNIKYFVIIDSLDMMAKRDDLTKPLEEAGQVAGGALITSVFLKKSSAALNKRGHICWFISQLRESIKVNKYAKETPRQGGASGGHAVEHFGDYVLEFLPRFTDDIIREGDKTSKIIGHYCRVKIVKSNNEKYGTEVRYPIKYGRKGATSVWVEREIIELLMSWEQIEKKGAWFKLSSALRDEIKENTGEEFPEQIQGMNGLYDILENNKKICSYLYSKLLKMVSSQ